MTKQSIQLIMLVIIEVTPGTFLEVFTEISIEFELENNNINILNLTFKSDLGAIVVNNSFSNNLSRCSLPAEGR
jgi:hypothetical protein